MNLAFIDKIRRNHALEHATVALMIEEGINGLVAGYATSNGFWLFSKAINHDVANASEKALKRLCQGNSSLAVSKNCGTNIVLTILVADLAFHLYRRITKSNSADFGARILISAASIAISNPLGLKIQQYLTTLSDVRRVKIMKVRSYKFGRMYLHKVYTIENSVSK